LFLNVTRAARQLSNKQSADHGEQSLLTNETDVSLSTPSFDVVVSTLTAMQPSEQTSRRTHASVNGGAGVDDFFQASTRQVPRLSTVSPLTHDERTGNSSTRGRQHDNFSTRRVAPIHRHNDLQDSASLH